MIIKRPGDWLQTFSGFSFWPLDPRPEEVCIEDIAHSLAMQCRFGGHSLRFYSVAEHSILVSQACSPENALWGLLHDASEAYLVDVPRPIKPFLPNYKLLEDGIMKCIAGKFDLPWPMPQEVKMVDSQILGNEKRAVMKDGPSWTLPHDPLTGIELFCWGPVEAEKHFMKTFGLINSRCPVKARAGGIYQA